MRITFAGVGEAFDETLANTSVLVESDTTSILLDCGFTAASAFWKSARKPLELDALYISHFHGDHFFGIPALLVRSIQEKRTKRLIIMGQYGVEDRITRLMEMAYSNAMAKKTFDIYYAECTPGEEIPLGNFQMRFAMSDHSMPCLSVRLDCAGKAVFYSGDGKPTDATQELATGCDLIVHESFSFSATMAGHGTIDSSIAFARTAQAQTLALVHMDRTVRRTREQDVLKKIKKIDDIRILLPTQNEHIEL